MAKCVNDIESKITSDLKNLRRWLHSNCLILNFDKTKTMLIGTHQRLSTVNNFMVMANNINLTTVGTFKYLGTALDQTLSWKDHVSSSRVKRFPLDWECLVEHVKYYLSILV